MLQIRAPAPEVGGSLSGEGALVQRKTLCSIGHDILVLYKKKRKTVTDGGKIQRLVGKQRPETSPLLCFLSSPFELYISGSGGIPRPDKMFIVDLFVR